MSSRELCRRDLGSLSGDTDDLGRDSEGLSMNECGGRLCTSPVTQLIHSACLEPCRASCSLAVLTQDSK